MLLVWLFKAVIRLPIMQLLGCFSTYKSGIELDFFRMMYEVYYKGKIRDDKFKIEYLKHKDVLNKTFIAN